MLGPMLFARTGILEPVDCWGDKERIEPNF